eukprot:c8331_g1_i1.p1 GENE.c8331_g1_i1~~c8331_g1_i1.p1  ORF type:complete len:102 (-),score=4.43 c8331_g1_i1:174-479(-)
MLFISANDTPPIRAKSEFFIAMSSQAFIATTRAVRARRWTVKGVITEPARWVCSNLKSPLSTNVLNTTQNEHEPRYENGCHHKTRPTTTHVLLHPCHKVVN